MIESPEHQTFFQVEALSKSFGALIAVNQVSFSVEETQILGIAGPNGSGKSTLFNIITNIPFRADKGRVIFKGNEIQHRANHEICRHGIARTFQRENVFPTLSAIDNVLTAVENSGKSGSLKANERRAEQALDLVGFPATMHNTLAGNLPVYFRKQVMIASAMSLEPVVLLLDEPASGLTQTEIDRMEQLIRRLNELGVTILLIEHILPLLTSVSDRMIVLDQGGIISTGTAEQVIRDPQVIEAYLGEAG